ncbi:MAG: GAF domain-containing sensor histidine kinase [Burkholderiaceae bacterium]
MNSLQSRGDPTVLSDAQLANLIGSSKRLAAVHKTQLLDAAVEETFDAITRLTARLVNASASFVSIIDEDRDFYTSQIGFPSPLAEQRQLSGRTFCHYTLAGDLPLVIEDTHSNPVWKAVPTVTSLGVRSYVGVPLKLNGETVGSLCVIDVKPRTWSDDDLEALQQLAASVAREIGLRSAVVDAEKEATRARALARSKEELVAVVAHDMRTPLQVLQFSTEVLQRAHKGEHDVITNRMVAAIDAMKGISNTLLTSNALSPSADQMLRDFKAGALAEGAIGMMHPIAERMGLSLILGEVADVTVNVNYGQMLRALGNVVGNAIKFSPKGSSIVVTGSRSGDTLTLTVADQGRGMSDADQARAFEHGWQSGEGILRGDGAGLGLTIVRKLVADNQGSVTLSSELGRGTTVSICLPCK